MKRLILSLFLSLIAFSAFSQTFEFKATDFSYKTKTGSQWSKWSKWEQCDVPITVDMDDDLVVIYSSETQVYNIYDVGRSYTEGNAQVQEFNFIDQDGDFGAMLFVVRETGRSELYVKFSDIEWGYVVKRIE